MKVLFDANVVVDLFLDSPDFDRAFIAMDVALLREFELCLAASCVPSVAYLLEARKLVPKHEVRGRMRELLDFFEVVDLVGSDCRSAAACDGCDFEDELIACPAKRAGVDFVVTRDKKGFAASPVPAVTPQEFIDLFKPANVEYEMLHGLKL